MKNILKSVLFTLALLTPSAGFAMYLPSLEEELELQASSEVAPVAGWDESECICLGAEPSNDHITLHTPAPCHTFHKNCITPWLQQHDTCPTCTREVINLPLQAKIRSWIKKHNSACCMALFLLLIANGELTEQSLASCFRSILIALPLYKLLAEGIMQVE